MTTHRLVKALLAIFLGLAIGISLGSLILHTDLPWFINLLILLVLSLAGTALATVLLRRVILPGLQRYTWKIRILWTAICLMGGILLAFTLPWTSIPRVNHLTIIATGEKHDSAQGQEVWLAAITTDQRAYTTDLPQICQGNWRIIDEMLVSSQAEQNVLECQIRSDDRIKLKFGTHPWSGYTSILLNGQKVDQDLYSATGGVFETTLTVTLTRTEQVARIGLIVANVLTLSLLLMTLSIWAIQRPLERDATTPRAAIAWYLYAAPLFVVWSIYLVVYWPGFFSPDTLDQFEMFVKHTISDWHPAFHTLTLWLLTRLWFSPAATILPQILLLSGLLGWGFTLIEQSGTPRRATFLAAGFLALSPAIALILLNPWKDVAYSICLVALAIFIFQVIQSNGDWLKNRPVWILLGIVIALVSLYRHNGAVVVFGSLLLLLVGYPKRWKPLLWAGLLGLVLILIVRGPVYRLAGVNRRESLQGNNLGVPGAAINLLDWHRQSGTPLSPELEFMLDDVLTREGEGPRLNALSLHSAELNRQALQVSLDYPLTTLGFLWERGKYIFQILKPSQGRIGYVEMAIHENPYGFAAANRFPWATDFLRQVASLSEKIHFDWLFWRNAFWMYVLLAGGIVAWVRMRNWRYLLLTTLVLLNSLPLAILSAGNIARYIFPTLLIGPLFGVYLWLASPSRVGQAEVELINRQSLGKKMARSSVVLKSAVSIQSNFQAFSELISLLTRHRTLTYILARREITDRYAGQFFGVMWTFVHPFITILVYVFLFTFVYTTRVGVDPGTPLDRTAYIIAGIIPWLAFSDVMGKSSNMILNNSSLVKQVIFPIEVLPVKGVIASFFIEVIFLTLLVLYTLITSHTLLWTYLLLPVAMFFQALLLIGLGYIISAVGTYVRDTRDFVQIFLQIGFWFVPLLYLPEQIPAAVQPILYLNPLTYMILCFQDVLFFGRIAHPVAWIIFPVLSLVVFLYGYRLFRRLKVMFGNVL